MKSEALILMQEICSTFMHSTQNQPTTRNVSVENSIIYIQIYFN